MSVSSSQGLMSRRTEVLAMRAGFLDFFSWYAFNLSSVILFFSSLSSSSELQQLKKSVTQQPAYIFPFLWKFRSNGNHVQKCHMIVIFDELETNHTPLHIASDYN